MAPAIRRCIVVLALGPLLLVARPVFGDPAGRVPVDTTPHFAFFSDFDTNLNDALVNAGVEPGYRPMPAQR